MVTRAVSHDTTSCSKHTTNMRGMRNNGLVLGFHVNQLDLLATASAPRIVSSKFDSKLHRVGSSKAIHKERALSSNGHNGWSTSSSRSKRNQKSSPSTHKGTRWGAGDC